MRWSIWSATGIPLDLIPHASSCTEPTALQVSTSEGLTTFKRLLQEGEVGLFITFGGATSQLRDFALNHTENQSA